MKKFDTEKELIDWIETMHLQNTSGRETENEMFRLGIEAAIEELKDLKLLNLPDISGSLPTDEDINNWCLPKGKHYSFRREGANWCKSFIQKLNTNDR